MTSPCQVRPRRPKGAPVQMCFGCSRGHWSGGSLDTCIAGGGQWGRGLRWDVCHFLSGNPEEAPSAFPSRRRPSNVAHLDFADPFLSLRPEGGGQTPQICGTWGGNGALARTRQWLERGGAFAGRDVTPISPCS